MRCRERYEGHVVKRGSAPQRERGAHRGRGRRESRVVELAAPLLHEALELRRVELVGLGAQAIARGRRGDDVAAQRLA